MLALRNTISNRGVQGRVSKSGIIETSWSGNEDFYIVPCFCLRGPKEITDSWEEIFAAEADGSYLEKYQISDYKPLDLGAEGIINMQIAAFDVDDLADGSGKAHVSWIGRETLKTKYYFNVRDFASSGAYEEGFGAIGGWEKSALRSYLKGSIKTMIPALVRNQIVDVTKTQNAHNTEGREFTQTTQDDIWIPSDSEVDGSKSIYCELFPNAANRIKKGAADETSIMWWLRNTRNTYSVRICMTDGAISSGTTSANRGVVLCFCT